MNISFLRDELRAPHYFSFHFDGLGLLFPDDVRPDVGPSFPDSGDDLIATQTIPAT